MNFLFYNNYNTGRAGLSNGIMSFELAVLFSHFTNRVLVIEGNISPPGNLVSYGDRVTNAYRSKVTDLFDLPVPWLALEHIDLSGYRFQEFFPYGLTQSVFYYPPEHTVSSVDFEYFRQGRRYAFTYPHSFERFEVLSMSGGRASAASPYKLHNFGFYSTLFYLGAEEKRRLRNILTQMRPKAYLSALSSRIASSLGRYNAVHVRLGDFKGLPAKSVGLRSPEEIIHRLDHNFDRSERLVILTDEADHPFIQQITKVYRHSIILDQFILDEYGRDFVELPYHDSLALAFLSQLVAVAAIDFVGSMTSTFTALIQRWRGNSGKEERFKFLWDDIPTGSVPAPGNGYKCENQALHPNGEMVKQRDGPYSWNRVDPRVNTAWMREWPEGFIRQPKPPR